MSSPPPPTASIFTENPYAGHPNLSPIEAEILWEYAKLAQNVKQVVTKTRQLSEEPDQLLVSRLRSLEKKMGLVLILFKASVWNVINEQPAEPSYSEHYADASGDTTIKQ